MNHFTSDGHFWHTNVLKYCPERKYKDIEEMNEMFIKNWNDVVAPDDTVYYIGDFSLALRPVETYTSRLLGRKILISGNHDWTHPANKKSRGVGQQLKWERKYIHHGWEAVRLELFLELKNGMKVRLYHMPYLDTRDTKQNHKNYRLVDDGIPLLCGHVHQHWTVRWTKDRKTPQINVGVDRWNFTPVNEDTICKTFEEAEPPKWQSDAEVEHNDRSSP